MLCVGGNNAATFLNNFIIILFPPPTVGLIGLCWNLFFCFSLLFFFFFSFWTFEARAEVWKWSLECTWSYQKLFLKGKKKNMDSSRILSWIKHCHCVWFWHFRLCSAPGSKGCFNCDFKTTRMAAQEKHFILFFYGGVLRISSGVSQEATLVWWYGSGYFGIYSHLAAGLKRKTKIDRSNIFSWNAGDKYIRLYKNGFSNFATLWSLKIKKPF